MANNKSDHYQYRIIEISLEPHKLNNFSNESGIQQHMTDMIFDDEMVKLRQELLEEIYNVIYSDQLTNHQQKVLIMTLNGLTQNEIAENLGITQSAIHKALSGNLDYKNNKKRYGGVIKKLQKISKANNKIKTILEKIETHKKIQLEQE